jgi:hypothetical protein
MDRHIETAVYDNDAAAERAVSKRRRRGIRSGPARQSHHPAPRRPDAYACLMHNTVRVAKALLANGGAGFTPVHDAPDRALIYGGDGVGIHRMAVASENNLDIFTRLAVGYSVAAF